MKGKYHINLKIRNREYNLSIERQFTILLGESSTGKSYFVDQLNAVLNDPNTSIRNSVLSTNIDTIIVYTNQTQFAEDPIKVIKSTIKKNRKMGSSIIIMDEVVVESLGSRIGELVSSDSYFLFVTRKPIIEIPYSIFSIYTFECQVKMLNGNKYFASSLCHLYEDKEKWVSPDLLIAEDSTSGYYFYVNSLNITVVSSNGNTKILKILRTYIHGGKYKNIVVLVDSAAYGSLISQLVEFATGIYGVNITILVPESFEWLILRSKLCRNLPMVSSVLGKPYDFCETTKFASYEQMFTKCLSVSLKNRSITYSKGRISNRCLNALSNVSDEVLDMLGIDESCRK